MTRQPHRFAFPAVLAGSTALAFGPWLVRLAGVGPVAAGFWRLALALPFLFAIAALTASRSIGPAANWRCWLPSQPSSSLPTSPPGTSGFT